MDEADALLDVALEALDRGVQESLLLVGDARQGVLGLLDTIGLKCGVSRGLGSLQNVGGVDAYAKLNGDGEEFNTSGLGDLLAAWYTGQVDVAGLDQVLLASGSLQHLLREATAYVSFLQLWCGKD